MSFVINPYAFAAASDTDASFASVVLLLGFEGADASTTFTDESPSAHSVGLVGNAQVDTAQFKYGASSGLFDGTGDRAFVAQDTDWQFGSGNFTVEGWYRFANNTTTQCLASLYAATTSNRSWVLNYNGAAATDSIAFNYSTNGSAVAGFGDAWTPTVGTWYHIAVVRNGNDFKIYIDGVGGATHTAAVTLFSAATPLRIGNLESGGESQYFNGHMDEVRITKGVARYTSNFTPPTAAFPRS